MTDVLPKGMVKSTPGGGPSGRSGTCRGWGGALRERESATRVHLPHPSPPFSLLAAWPLFQPCSSAVITTGDVDVYLPFVRLQGWSEAVIVQKPQVKFQLGTTCVGVVVHGWRGSPLLVLSDCQGAGLLSPEQYKGWELRLWGRVSPQIQPPDHPHTHLRAVPFNFESISYL